MTHTVETAATAIFEAAQSSRSLAEFLTTLFQNLIIWNQPTRADMEMIRQYWETRTGLEELALHVLPMSKGRELKWRDIQYAFRGSKGLKMV